MKRYLLIALIAGLTGSSAFAQTPDAASTPGAAAAPSKPTALTDADLKSVEAPKPEVRAKGDPDGGLTGTAADVAWPTRKRD